MNNDNALNENQPGSDMEQILVWIGVHDRNKRLLLIEEFGDNLNVFAAASEKMVKTTLKELNDRNREQSRVRLNLDVKTKFLGVYHWVQDQVNRLNQDASILSMSQEEFLASINLSLSLASVREHEMEGMQSRADDASPGKLKKESDWPKWETGILNMFSILQGVNGVPLLYVVREKEHVDGTLYESFHEEVVARAPQEGPAFIADAKVVHQIITSLTQGENAEQWIKSIRKKINGRLDMQALRTHFRGAGNMSRRISVAESMSTTLIYKHERAMSFNVFLEKAKKMFEIYSECNEVKSEKEKLRWLFNAIRSDALKLTVEAIQVAIDQNVGAYTFDSAADFLASKVSMSSASTRNVSSAYGQRHGKSYNGAPDKGIMKNGQVFTGSFPDKLWAKLKPDEQKQVRDARSNQRGRGNKGKSSYGKLSRENENLRRKIKALKSKSDEKGDEKSDTEKSIENDAGNSFGDRAEKERTEKEKKRVKTQK